MNILLKSAIVTAAVTMTTQPCLAAVVEIEGAPATVTTASAAAVKFNLGRHAAARSGLDRASVAAAALASNGTQQVPETDNERRRRGPGSTTFLVIGGVVLLVVLLAAVASATPSPGPDEGAFD